MIPGKNRVTGNKRKTKGPVGAFRAASLGPVKRGRRTELPRAVSWKK